MQSFRVISKCIACLVALTLAAGCASTPKVSPELSENMRQLAEMRDTCTQYAAWVARDFKSDAPEFKRAQQLYIEASASANSYIEALQFDVAVGGSYSEEKYKDAAQRVHDTSKAFLDYSREAVGVTKTRFLPLVIPLAASLIDLGNKVNGAIKAAKQQERELISKSIADKKWKPFNELVK
jgi:hypothetical protein